MRPLGKQQEFSGDLFHPLECGSSLPLCASPACWRPERSAGPAQAGSAAGPEASFRFRKRQLRGRTPKAPAARPSFHSLPGHVPLKDEFLARVAELRHREHGEASENFSVYSAIQRLDASDGGRLRGLRVKCGLTCLSYVSVGLEGR